MSIKQNPFTSKIFVTKWHQHFNKNYTEKKLSFVENLTFFKTTKFSIFINSGKNLSKGISYTTKKTIDKSFNKYVALIYDVPKYFNIDNSKLPNNIDLHKIKQYPGYLVELTTFKNFDDYFQQQFSKKSRAKLNRYQKRLELCFEITYKMYVGEILKEEYDVIFTAFKEILEKRFSEKQTTNNNLQIEEWRFYYDVTYPLILENKAALFVIYQGGKPIGVTLNYLSKDILFHGITSFDIDYSKFHLGKVMLKNLMKWSFENDLKTFDFSKGHFDYKTEWMTKKYNFEYHLFIDQSSYKSIIIGHLLRYSLTFKQYLREKEVNKKLHQLTYKFKKNKSSKRNNLRYYFFEISEEYSENKLSKVELDLKENYHLKKIIHEFLFLNSEKLSEFRISKIKGEESEYLFRGLKNQKILKIEL